MRTKHKPTPPLLTLHLVRVHQGEPRTRDLADDPIAAVRAVLVMQKALIECFWKVRDSEKICPELGGITAPDVESEVNSTLDKLTEHLAFELMTAGLAFEVVEGGGADGH